MANTYSQQYVHTVFAVKYRKSALTVDIRPTAFAIIGQQIKDAGCESLIVGGVEDRSSQENFPTASNNFFSSSTFSG